MQTSGFSSTPTTLVLLLLCTTISLLASITSTKHHLALYPYPQLYPYLQLQRVVTHQLGHSSSTDLLFSSVLLYQLRVLERALGTRKFVSFVLMSGGWEAVVAPLVLTGVVRPLSWGAWDHIPAGMTAVVMAALAVWAVEVPRLWRWELVVPSFAAMRRRRRRRGGGGGGGTEADDGSGSGSGSSKDEVAAGDEGRETGRRRREWTITFSDKTPTYLLALQLALTQFPYTLLPASTGYLIGLAWHGDFLPARMSGWRVPRWMVGEAPLLSTRTQTGRRGWGGGIGAVERERYEGLRRRLEEEGGRGGDGDGMRQAAHATTASGQDQDQDQAAAEARTRPMGAQIADYFRGVF